MIVDKVNESFFKIFKNCSLKKLCVKVHHITENWWEDKFIKNFKKDLKDIIYKSDITIMLKCETE